MDVDLTRHAVIEASAGTGKTHTIEDLVLRLVTELEVPPDQLLIVTFTEKATGELKSRLRSTLQRGLRASPERQHILQPALDHFDQLPIFTIHGFCQRLLQEYALEQGQDFRAALADDVELLRIGLREVQRKLWRASFAERLREVLEHSGYCRDTAEGWDEMVLHVAERYKPRCGHRLRPAPALDWWQRLGEADFSGAGQLEVQTIELLQQYLQDYKRQRGLQSFDDMIAQVEENLDPERNPLAEQFLQTLRQRYRYGIVDEFQDTDPLQWRIFRRIFLGGGASRLIVVGDPKQAIFGFRGADLPTYLQAARDMTAEYGARDYPLQTNWRSEPELLEALNSVFLDGGWFPEESGIRYLPVSAPPEEQRQTRIVDDRSDRAALSVVDLKQWGQLKVAQRQYVRFMAREIQYLLQPGREPRLVFTQRGKPPRALDPGDICILVLTRRDAEPVMTALRDVGIAYSFYKQTGLWQTEEALQIEALLRSLARPEDRSSLRKALLTCFFRLTPQDLLRGQDLPPQHPARQLYQTWLALADGRHWSTLFQSLLEDTGVLFAGEGAVDVERRRACMRHLLGTLEQAGHGANLDLLGLLDWIKARRQQRDAVDSEPAPLESQRSRVKIMTVHASKGLEFPIVFLAGGFTRRKPTGGPASYRDEEGRLVFDVCPDAEAKQRVEQETLSEQRRLLYVALTRAIFKLYVPRLQPGLRSRAYAGPLASILVPALEQSAVADRLGFPVVDVLTPGLMAPPGTSPPADEPATRPQPFTWSGPLFPHFDRLLERRRIVIRSFSSMSRQRVAPVGTGASYGDLAILGVDESAAAPEVDDPLRGPAFGDIVHGVLEKIDFAEVAQAESSEALLRAGSPARRLLESEVRAKAAELRTRANVDDLEQRCLTQVAALVWHALRTPLRAPGCRLCDVPAADRLHELEFYYPEYPDGPVPTEVRREESFLAGVMDLVFRRDGRYFLVDYKTNLLSGYTTELVTRCMTEADYHRQYQLYLQALSRWLRRAHGERFNFSRQFGGVYYLFVRGLNGRDETSGVFFREPDRRDLDLGYVLSR
jgi:exodeoxyribonuclease V beta subunit